MSYQFFKKFNELLKPWGQALLDSSDVSYLYEKSMPENNYFGEIDYQYEYQDEKGPWFKWLYADMEILTIEAEMFGYQLQVLSEDSNGQYLARMIRLD